MIIECTWYRSELTHTSLSPTLSQPILLSVVVSLLPPTSVHYHPHSLSLIQITFIHSPVSLSLFQLPPLLPFGFLADHGKHPFILKLIPPLHAVVPPQFPPGSPSLSSIFLSSSSLL
ncbi:hypothetical protein CRENBAI_023781 [Crenichthys baileyi]|uniref:Uncharacterized protein n=1 Tax=Crenichthys baileyi TaxID=28760 RepID=A0AAV9QPS4_9TELE